MARKLKDIASLYRLLESAPLSTLHEFLTCIDEGRYAAHFVGIHWPDTSTADDDPGHDDVRQTLLQCPYELTPEIAVPLERHAQRVLTLSTGQGPQSLERAAQKIAREDQRAVYENQWDNLGRALWLYLHEEALFDEAENLHYAHYFRNYGNLHEAFEVNAESVVDFEWDDTIRTALEAKVRETLSLKDACKIIYFKIHGRRQNDADSHLMIVRHAGPLSSVDAMKGELKKPMYYRPAIEATVLFSPKDGVVEVFSQNPGIRTTLATTFAEVALRHDLSGKPLTLKQYNLSRFLLSLKLPVPVIEGFEVESAAVVEITVRPSNPKHRLTYKVTEDDDIEAEADALFGPNHVIKRASHITRIIIAIRYSAGGEGKSKLLTLALSEPNRCNLRSNADPQKRELGYALLEKWGILQNIRQLNAQEDAQAFPALLALYDHSANLISRHALETRGFDVEVLQIGGFLERRGRAKTMDIERDNGDVCVVPIHPSRHAGYVRYECPDSGEWVERPSHTLELFEIKRAWLEERVLKALHSTLKPAGQRFREEGITFLGYLTINNESVPCYLAAQLHDPNRVSAYDVQLRARHDWGIGIVLATRTPHPAFLGANVVIAFSDLLVADTSEITVDMHRLTSVYVHNKLLARGGMTVDFVESDHYNATLFIPGKPPLQLSGAQQIKIVRRLVDAQRSGNPAVVAKALMDDTGMTSPSQAFRKPVWKSINEVYLGKPQGKRGSWMLLV